MDPLLVSIAEVLAGKTAEAVFKGGASVARKAVEAVRRRFGDEPAEVAILDRTVSGAAPVETLAKAIAHACETDPQFRSELEAIVGRPIQIAGVVKFQNNFHDGAPANVVQAETINNFRLG